MFLRLLFCVTCIVSLMACVTFTEEKQDISAPPDPVRVVFKPMKFEKNDHALGAWWSFFSDPVLDKLISAALSLNARSKHEPYQDEGSKPQKAALSKYYHDQNLDLIANVIDAYIKFRYAQNQKTILEQSLKSRMAVLAHVDLPKENRDKDPRLSDFFAQNAAIEKQIEQLGIKQKNQSEQLTESTRLLPEFIADILKTPVTLTRGDINPLLSTKSNILNEAKEVKVARAQFEITQKIFPDMNLNTFFGIDDAIFANPDLSWHIIPGQSVQSLILFDNMPDEFKADIMSYVLDLEQEMVRYTHLKEQADILKKSLEKQEKDFGNLREYIKENEATFTRLLDLEGSLQSARMAVLRAKTEQLQTLSGIYLKIGVY